MALWSRITPPRYSPLAVPTKNGWAHPVTGELLVAMSIPPAILATAPVVTQVKIARNKVKFRTGDLIDFQVTFNEAVTVTGTPKLPFTVNSTGYNALYTKGSGSPTLHFGYIVQSGDSATAGQVVLGSAPTAASLTLGTTNSQMVFTAKTAGTAGNSITVALVNPSADYVASKATLIGSAISVSLATNEVGTIISTPEDVQTAIGENPDTAALVSVGYGAGNGTGVVVVAAATNLTGGAAGTTVSLNLNSGTITATNKFATLTLGTSNAQVLYTAVIPGAYGNNVTVAYINPGTASAALSVSVTGNAITVNLATNSSSVITSTSALVQTAIKASAAASALVTVSNGGGTGASVVVAAAATNLTGGTSNSVNASLACPGYTASTVTLN